MSESFYSVHLFLCTNKRDENHPRPSCGRMGSVELLETLKAKVREKGLGKGNRFQQAGCLDRCELGPVLVVYPQGTWYRVETAEDIDEILTSHLQNGVEVERLRLQPSDKKRSDWESRCQNA